MRKIITKQDKIIGIQGDTIKTQNHAITILNTMLDEKKKEVIEIKEGSKSLNTMFFSILLILLFFSFVGEFAKRDNDRINNRIDLEWKLKKHHLDLEIEKQLNKIFVQLENDDEVRFLSSKIYYKGSRRPYSYLTEMKEKWSKYGIIMDSISLADLSHGELSDLCEESFNCTKLSMDTKEIELISQCNNQKIIVRMINTSGNCTLSNATLIDHFMN